MNNYENLINTLLDNRYRLIKIVGIGGMAIIYEADDLVMHKKVAIKMLKDDTKEDEETVKRFINESKAAAMLSHQNIARIFDVSGIENEKCRYFAMELIDGINLKEYIVKKGRLGWKAAISYAGKILNALGHAHSKGIIHRDIKPQNAMLLKDGNLKITDFGIAKMQNSEPLTMTDKAIGTVHYISPEQANGTQNITNVSDIYSVGVILYEMTTGELPFVGNTAIQVAMMQINDIPKDPRSINPEIPKGLSQIILKAMRKDPRDRYQSAGEMLKQLGMVYRNPAVVFGNTNAGGSNLPVAVTPNTGQKSQSIEASRMSKNRAIEVSGDKKVAVEPDEIQKKGRKTKKNVLKPRNSKSMLPFILGVTLALFIVLVWCLIQLASGYMDQIIPSEDKHENTIEIGNYVKRIYNDEFIAELAELRLVPGKISYVSNENFEAGEIVAHKPAAKEIKKYANDKSTIAIDFTISTGKDTYVVEDLTIMESRNVRLMLEQKKLLVEIKYESHETVPSGYIIYTEPGFGSLMEAGDTIILHTSSGIALKTVKMPDLVGMTEREARSTLARAEIIIEQVISEYSEEYEKGCIIKQSIAPFKDVPRKSTRVILHKSLGSINPEPAEN